MKKKGIGIAIGEYPTGASGGGDPAQALVRVNPDGSVDLIIGSVDIGQGCKTVLAQMAAEVLGIPYEQVTVFNEDTNVTPYCFGTFATRVTYVAGNATVAAALEAKQILLEVAAGDLGVPPEELETGDGKIFVKAAPDRSVSFNETAGKALYGMKKIVVGRGHYMRNPCAPDPETGATDPFATLAWAGVLAEVEVDTETGEVEVTRLVTVYDVGKAINPMLVEGQMHGGAGMAVGAALMEQMHPYHPSMDWRPASLGEYILPTAMDVPDIETGIVECPSTEGPFGAKGIGEMTANTPTPAIINAIHNAIGVWITENPITPEKILRALEAQAAGEF